MSHKDAHLYGVKRSSKAADRFKAAASSTNTTFGNALSSLIAASSSSASASASASSSAGTRPARTDKHDSPHSRGLKLGKGSVMNAAKQSSQAAKRKPAAEPLDEDDYRKSRRKMEEKARIYAALKRGDINDDTEKHMVDFDRKWTERDAEDADSNMSSDDDEGSIQDEQKVEYVDELGRTRVGSALDAQRAERLKAGLQEQEQTARPAPPTQLIYGDTIQHDAFDLDAPAAQRMAELAAKRDRELTPPEAVHYDATREIRTKGTGFFQFSKDEDVRQDQMQELERERERTELQRLKQEEESNARKAKRKRDLEERRKKVNAQRAEAKADQFLAGLEPTINAEKPES